jgi:phage baseplate assembly protein W
MASNLYSKIVIPEKSTGTTATPKMYRGFSTVNTSTENFSLYDFELIKQDLINHFYIRQGERLMQPRFGTVIWDLLFEPLTEEVKAVIRQNVDEILNYDPRVQAGNVLITPYDTGLQIECTLKYLPYNISQALQLKFDQANGLLTTSL